MKKIIPASAAVEANYRNLYETMAKRLEARGHIPFYAPDAESALKKVLELIPSGASVGVPGSVTIREIGALEALEARGCKIVQHWLPGATADVITANRFEEANCDVLLTSSNAITKDGQIVNIDGGGNRVAAMAWSRGDKIFVISMNKVCGDVDSAIKRVRDCATPPNALRLHCQTPCAKLGCHAPNGCVSPNSVCRVIMITDQAPTNPGKSYVILVGEPLGY